MSNSYESDPTIRSLSMILCMLKRDSNLVTHEIRHRRYENQFVRVGMYHVVLEVVYILHLQAKWLLLYETENIASKTSL